MVSLKKFEDNEEGKNERRFKDHAWFIAYAPATQPSIAIAVLVENAGGGGVVAAPVARKVMKAYLRIEDPPLTTPESTEQGPDGPGPVNPAAHGSGHA